MVRFYQEVSTPVQGVCYSLKRFGGRWFAAYQVFSQLIRFFFAVFFFSLNHGGSQLTSFFLSWPVFLPFLLFSLNHGGSQLTRFFRSLPGFFLPFLFFSTLNLGIFQAFDGDKFVCMDSYSPTDCLVYSFGIRFGHPRGVQSWCWAKRHPCIHPSIHASLIQRQRYILQIGKDLDIFRYYVPTNTEKTIHNEKYIFKYDQQTLRSEWEFEDLMDSLNCTVI